MFDPFLAVSQAIEFYAVFVFFALFAISIFTARKRSALLLALVLAAVSGPLLKEYYQQERPCVDGPGGIPCPQTTGLPSLHAMASTVFAIASIGTPAFLFFAPAAAIISLSRIYLNVHSPEQVAAGMAVGIALFSFAAGIRARFGRERPFAANAKKQALARNAKSAKGAMATGNFGFAMELRRQALHVLFGAATIATALAFGMPFATTLLAVALTIGLLGVGLVMLGYPVPFAREILQAFERKKVMPGKGAMHYAAGCLLLMTFAPANFALAMIAVLAFGDGTSTVIGKFWGKNKLPWNSRKSWLGTATFFAFGAVSSAFFIPVEQALAYSLVLALIETVPADVDDNLLIPVAALALQAVAKALFGV